MGSLSQHGKGPVVTAAKGSKATETTREGFLRKCLKMTLTGQRSLVAADGRLWDLM